MAIAGIVAGGSGSRMGSAKPKQFIELCGRPVIIHTVGAFLKNPLIDHVIIGINPEWYDYTKELLQNYGMTQVKLTKGGSDRNETLLNIIRCAKEELSCADDEIILTHDAVRPFVSEKMISDSIEALQKYRIVTAAIPATDTIIISADGEEASDFPVRSTVYQVQTPQSFRLGDFTGVLSQASRQERQTVTDACKLFHLRGYAVGLVEGDRRNIKITYPSDMTIAQAICETEEKQ